jgi:hypothetical protein
VVEGGAAPTIVDTATTVAPTEGDTLTVTFDEHTVESDGGQDTSSTISSIDDSIKEMTLPRGVFYAKSLLSFIVKREGIDKKLFRLRSRVLKNDEDIEGEINTQKRRAIHYHATGVVLEVNECE